MAHKPLGILIVADDRLPRERTQAMARGVAILRQADCAVEVLSGGQTEDSLIAHIQKGLADPSKQPVQLVLAPWHLYLKWSRLEGFFGLTRTHGATVAGYFGEPVAVKSLPDTRDIQRVILLDLSNLDAQEWARVVRAAGFDSLRSGCLGLLAAGTPVYVEHWLNGTQLGPRIDSLATLPEVSASQDWQKRLPVARVVLSSLWSLIFEEGAGRADFYQPPKTFKASIQTGMDAKAWVFRLCFTATHMSSSEIMNRFWPKESETWSLPAQLRSACDLLRVHWVPENNTIEITAVLFQSAPSVVRPQDARSLWLDPIQAAQMIEGPTDKPGSAPHLRPWALTPSATPGTKSPAQDERQTRINAEMAAKLKDLTQMVRERDEVIRELRAGGVSTAPPMPPPDTEALLEAFQFRFSEADDELRRLEISVMDAEKNGTDVIRLAAMKRRIAELTEKEKAWIRSIAQTLERYRSKRASGG